MQKISVIIPTMKGREKLLDRLLKSIPKGVEVIVVPDEDKLLAAKRNLGASKATGDMLLFIDDDNYLNAGAIQALRDEYSESIGVMGLMACYHDKPTVIADGGSMRSLTSGLMRGMNTNYDLKYRSIEPYAVDEVANAFMVPKMLFDYIGGFNETCFPIDLDEADLCRRIKDMGFEIIMNSKAICYHESQTYSVVPDFRRPMNAYFMARNKVVYQKIHCHPYQLLVYCLIFMPMTWIGYMACLIYRKKPYMALEFTRGMIDGLLGRFENKYQKR